MQAFRIARVVKGDNWHDTRGGPLSRLGMDVNPGDFILALNGRPLNKVRRDTAWACAVGAAACVRWSGRRLALCARAEQGAAPRCVAVLTLAAWQCMTPERMLGDHADKEVFVTLLSRSVVSTDGALVAQARAAVCAR